jgi:hypothetical protein
LTAGTGTASRRRLRRQEDQDAAEEIRVRMMEEDGKDEVTCFLLEGGMMAFGITIFSA